MGGWREIHENAKRPEDELCMILPHSGAPGNDKGRRCVHTRGLGHACFDLPAVNRVGVSKGPAQYALERGVLGRNSRLLPSPPEPPRVRGTTGLSGL
jgi:hypothetical protein